jgi:hypothetical protein
MRNTAGGVLLAIVYLAALFLLVRPGSGGPGIVSAISQGISGLINSATGGGGWSGTK